MAYFPIDCSIFYKLDFNRHLISILHFLFYFIYKIIFIAIKTTNNHVPQKLIQIFLLGSEEFKDNFVYYE